MLTIILFIVSLLAFGGLCIIRAIRIECERRGENTLLWRRITALDQLVTMAFLHAFTNAIALLLPTEKFVADVWFVAASLLATMIFLLREMFVMRKARFLPQWAYYLQLLTKKKV